MDNHPIVKQYSKEYQAEVIDLILYIQQKEYNIPITKNDQPDLFAIEQFYQIGSGNFWVAIYNEKVVGTISLLDLEDRQVALRKMFVNKDFRGAKFKTASLLLNTAMNWAKENSVEAVYLGTTPQFLAAHRFYEKNGFTSINLNELPEKFPVLKVDKKFYRHIVQR